MLRTYPGDGKSVPPRSTLARSAPLSPTGPAPATGAAFLDLVASGVTVASLARLFGGVLAVFGAAFVDSSGRSAARGAGVGGVASVGVVTTPTEGAPAWAATM